MHEGTLMLVGCNVTNVTLVLWDSLAVAVVAFSSLQTSCEDKADYFPLGLFVI